MTGAYILQYERNDDELEILLSNPNLERFLEEIKKSDYPSPNKQLLVSSIAQGRTFNYCQGRFKIQYVADCLITGTEDKQTIEKTIKKALAK